MSLFHTYEEKPLTLKRKLLLWAMLFVLIPGFCFLYGKSELQAASYKELSRTTGQAVTTALPKELPTNIYDF